MAMIMLCNLEEVVLFIDSLRIGLATTVADQSAQLRTVALAVEKVV